MSLEQCTPNQRGGLQQLHICCRPMYAVLAIDILGPLPERMHGNTYLWTEETFYSMDGGICHICNKEAVIVAQKLVDKLFCHLSLPVHLHSDQGRVFESKVIKKITAVPSHWKDQDNTSLM